MCKDSIMQSVLHSKFKIDFFNTKHIVHNSEIVFFFIFRNQYVVFKIIFLIFLEQEIYFNRFFIVKNTFVQI